MSGESRNLLRDSALRAQNKIGNHNPKVPCMLMENDDRPLPTHEDANATRMRIARGSDCEDIATCFQD